MRPSTGRDAARALDDRELLVAMHDNDRWAWYEFDRRFRRALERHASRIGIATADWPECVQEVLEDTAMRFAIDRIEPPASLLGYMIRSVTNRAQNLARGRQHLGMGYIEDAPLPDNLPPRALTRRIAGILRIGLSAEEECLLAWVAEGVAYRQIAAWLGIGYDATAKRIARLNSRLRARLAELANTSADPEEREAMESLLEETREEP